MLVPWEACQEEVAKGAETGVGLAGTVVAWRGADPGRMDEGMSG
jgi:hypothetical protein